jgi:hypothetical protein
MTDETPATLRPALPELPDLAAELADVAEAAVMLYDEDAR